MANNNVMNEMVGKWKLEKRDNNFDEFLSCRQVGWFLRKLMTSSVADVEYSLSQDANTFTKVIIGNLKCVCSYKSREIRANPL